MELLLLLIIALVAGLVAGLAAGLVAGYLIGNYRRKKSAPPASQQVVEATAKDVEETA